MNPTIEEFISDIHCDQIENLIINKFEELFVLYRLGVIADIRAKILSNSVEFTILTDKKASNDEYREALSGKTFIIRGQTYYINIAEVTEEFIRVIVSK